MSRIEQLLEEIKQATIIGVKKYLTIDEAAIYLGISKGTLRNKMTNHEIPYYKPGGTPYFSKEELDGIMGQCKRNALNEY